TLYHYTTQFTTCTYTPAAGFTGADSFTYTVTDGPNTSAPATVDVTVNAIVPPNAIPVAVDDTATTGMNNQVIIDVLANDTDADAGDVITIAAGDAASTQGGTVVCVTGVPNGSCTYTPATGFTGADTFTYTATDGTDTSAPATVTVSVSGAGAPALYFSTLGAGSVPTVAGPFDDDHLVVHAGGRRIVNRYRYGIRRNDCIHRHRLRHRWRYLEYLLRWLSLWSGRQQCR
ncbi:MAG: Ig-like domain-containing protein, partial [Candidatus Thiodiazotropha sp.]